VRLHSISKSPKKPSVGASTIPSPLSWSAEPLDELRRRCWPKGEHQAAATTPRLLALPPRGAACSIHPSSGSSVRYRRR
jgi:hypothetical protein